MNKIMIALMLGISVTANAESITIPNSGETVTGDTKICFYSNSNYDFTYEVSVNRQCPGTRTFNTDDDEDDE